MVGWHHQLDGPEFEPAPGVGDGQGSLAYCSPWGLKVSDMTERLNNNRICASQVVPVVKNLPANAGDAEDTGLIPGSGISPGEGNGNLLQYSCQGNSMDRGA